MCVRARVHMRAHVEYMGKSILSTTVGPSSAATVDHKSYEWPSPLIFTETNYRQDLIHWGPTLALERQRHGGLCV